VVFAAQVAIHALEHFAPDLARLSAPVLGPTYAVGNSQAKAMCHETSE